MLDGRDIGTVVCPHATLKLFVTASLEERAARRLKELRERGSEAIDSRVLRDMRERDARDSARSVAPLRAGSRCYRHRYQRARSRCGFRGGLGGVASAFALEIGDARRCRASPSLIPIKDGGEDERAWRKCRVLTIQADRGADGQRFEERNEDRGKLRQMIASVVDTAADKSAHAGKESFAALLDESLGTAEGFEGRVVQGMVVAVENDMVVVDVGLKSEGRVPLKEFAFSPQDVKLQPGDTVEVYVERFEDRDGLVGLSREKARREEAWNVLERAFKGAERINGTIFGRVKGGFIVDLAGAVAFLPGSQVDIRPVRDITPLMNTPQPFQILKMDRSRNNIVVSRRAVLEETRAEARSELIANLKEGQILEGVVKNITDYGAFVDLGGVDGLLHVTDISWKRINHPVRGAADRRDGEGAGDPLQSRDATHFARHEAA